MSTPVPAYRPRAGNRSHLSEESLGTKLWWGGCLRITAGVLAALHRRPGKLLQNLLGVRDTPGRLIQRLRRQQQRRMRHRALPFLGLLFRLDELEVLHAGGRDNLRLNHNKRSLSDHNHRLSYCDGSFESQAPPRTIGDRVVRRSHLRRREAADGDAVRVDLRRQPLCEAFHRGFLHSIKRSAVAHGCGVRASAGPDSCGG